MAISLYNYTPVLPVNVSRPYFSTRPQGVHAKNLVSGDETMAKQVVSFGNMLKNAGLQVSTLSGNP